jgi:dUTP pyrophosphatase
LVKTGLFIELPVGYECQVRPRSGLAFKNGITVLNSPGTIDADYRGEIGIVIYNSADYIFTIHKGDRIAQGIMERISRPSILQVTELNETERGTGGFGSTGNS